MSEHNALKYGTNLGRLARGFGVGDEEDGITRLSETLYPIADVYHQPEWALLRGERLYARRVPNIPAVAARFGSCELVNPATSKIIVVIERIVTSKPVEMVVDTGPAVAANQVTSGGVALDTRVPQLGESSVLQIVTGDGATGAVLPQWVGSFISSDLLGPPRFVIVPGFKLFMADTTANEAWFLNLWWRERQAFPGELSKAF